MKIQNIVVSNVNLTNKTATITFDIAEATSNVDVYLKLNELDYAQIFTNKTNATLTYSVTTNLQLGINNANLKLVSSSEEYISETFLIKLKINPTISNIDCNYTDNDGRYTLTFDLTGDSNFKYIISIKEDGSQYKEIMNNQIIGFKIYRGSGLSLGNHSVTLKVTDGYDEYETVTYNFVIVNYIPIMSKVAITDIKNNGTCKIHYGLKDIENTTLTHILTLDGNNTTISPSKNGYFYTYNLTGLSVGKHNGRINISDGTNTVATDDFSIEIFNDSTNKKEQLRQAKIRYDASYRNFREIIVSIIADGIFDYDIENLIIEKSKNYYSEMYSEFNKIAQQTIDMISSNKIVTAKADLNKEINEVSGAINTLEDTMNTVFKDGVLSDAEKTTLDNTLNLVAKEKADVDREYETLYNNDDLLNPAKTKLKTEYDSFVNAHNTLVTTIDGLINKAGIIDNTDKENVDNAFANWRNRLGNYRNAALEAIDSIAKKKADDSADVVNKYWAEIILDPDTGIKSEVGKLQTKISGTGGIEERLKTAEQTITTEGISNLIKDKYYSKTEVDAQLDATVATVQVQYYLSTSTTSLAGGNWSTVAPEWEDGKYMWSKVVTTLTDGTVKESEPTCIAGASGTDGKSISAITKYYLATSSENVTKSTSGWTTTIQTISEDKRYLWNYEEVTFSDNTTFSTDPCIIGSFGLGSDAYTVILTNEAHVVLCDSDGNPIS